MRVRALLSVIRGGRLRSSQPVADANRSGGAGQRGHAEPDANHLVEASREALDLAIEAGRLHEGIVEVLLSNLACPTCTARALVWTIPLLAEAEREVVRAVEGAMHDVLVRQIEFPVPPVHPDTALYEDMRARFAARREAEEERGPRDGEWPEHGESA